MSYTFCPEKNCGCLSNSCFSSFYSSSVRLLPTWSPFRLVVEGLWFILAGGITLTWLRFVSSLKNVTCLSATGSSYRVVRFLPNLHSSLVRFIIGTWINSWVLSNTQFGVTHSFLIRINTVIEICRRQSSLLGKAFWMNIGEHPGIQPALRAGLSSAVMSCSFKLFRSIVLPNRSGLPIFVSYFSLLLGFLPSGPLQYDRFCQGPSLFQWLLVFPVS